MECTLSLYPLNQSKKDELVCSSRVFELDTFEFVCSSSCVRVRVFEFVCSSSCVRVGYVRVRYANRDELIRSISGYVS